MKKRYVLRHAIIASPGWKPKLFGSDGKPQRKKKTMKKATLLLASLALAFTVGCGTTGPLATQTGIFLAASGVLHNNKDLLPAAKVGAEIICAVADGTNANLVAVVAALDAAGPWKFEEWMLLNGIVVTAVTVGANASSGPAKPYLDAGCIGLRMAVAGAPSDAPQERYAPVPTKRRVRSAAQPAQNPKWPQMRYP